MILYILLMKSTATFYISITTFLLAAVAFMVYFDFSFSSVFYTVLAGQAWWLFTVYKVLTEDYSTEKTFDDWYEDYPE